MSVLDLVDQIRRQLGLLPLSSAGIPGVNDPGDHYREWEHPRDKNGQWIEKFGHVRVGDSVAGVVEGVHRNGTVRVRITASQDQQRPEGSRIDISPDEIEMIEAKASLEGITPDASETPPLASRPWSPRRPFLTGDVGDLDTSSWDGLIESLADRDIIVFDTETTGFDTGLGGRDVPIQIGAVRIRNGEVVDRFQTFVGGVAVPDFITGITGIDNNMTVNAPLAKEAYDDFARWAKIQPDTVIAGHNVSFDLDAISNMTDGDTRIPDDQPTIDTLALSRHLMPTDSGVVANRKLGTLADYFGIPLGDSAHRADADAEATGLVLGSLLRYGSESGSTVDVMNQRQEEEDRYNQELAAYADELARWRKQEQLKIKKLGRPTERKYRPATQKEIDAFRLPPDALEVQVNDSYDGVNDKVVVRYRGNNKRGKAGYFDLRKDDNARIKAGMELLNNGAVQDVTTTEPPDATGKGVGGRPQQNTYREATPEEIDQLTVPPGSIVQINDDYVPGSGGIAFRYKAPGSNKFQTRVGNNRIDKLLFPDNS